MTSVVQSIGDRVVGTVEEVSADRITVLLDVDAPQATALNTGRPTGFPRINNYVLIPNEGGATACVISSVRIQRFPFPMRKGMQKDFGLVDLPFPARMMSLTPLGTLKVRSEGEDYSFEVRRGVDVFPSVGDPVLLPGAEQLRAIVEGEARASQRILIGRCPTAGRAPVHVDPDKLFGRHLAVLGNTGAGKSCSVAGLIRWSLDAARTARGNRLTGAVRRPARCRMPASSCSIRTGSTLGPSAVSTCACFVWSREPTASRSKSLPGCGTGPSGLLSPGPHRVCSGRCFSMHCGERDLASDRRTRSRRKRRVERNDIGIG